MIAGRVFLTRSLLLWTIAVSCAGAPRSVPHSVQLSHPAVKGAKPQSYTLHQEQDEAGLPTGYALAVDSVICKKKTCEILKGRMLWDEIGRYRRYALPPGKNLTKKDHTPFTTDEYAHLDRLLRNPNSLLRDYAYEKLTAPESWDDVDAITGATAKEIQTEVVDGAGYTCYTLWHWANGDAASEIRKLTAASLNAALACRFLDSGDGEAVLFALRALDSSNLRDDRITQAVSGMLHQAKSTQLLLSLCYLSRATGASAAFHKDTAALFWKLPGRERQTLLDFVESQPAVPAAFFDALCEGLPALTEYYELHRILALVEKHDYLTSQLTARVAALLTHKNFFIARRAYWFLEKRKLSAEERKAVDVFLEKHRDRL